MLLEESSTRICFITRTDYVLIYYFWLKIKDVKLIMEVFKPRIFASSKGFE